jgi:F-type H+-transporting ATPase subunit b
MGIAIFDGKGGFRVQGLKIILTTLCFFLLSTTAAIAGDEEYWSNTFFRIINIALFIGFITYLWGKKIVGFFKDRSQSIAAEISSLEERKKAAEQSLADVERRIANLEQERQAIIADYTAQGETLKAAAIQEAEKVAAQIIAQAKVTAQNEIKAAVDAMRAEMADKVVEATEKLIVKKLSAPKHTSLVDQYLTKVVLN